jgi:NAD(P)-dependent dehydrogenase (short-subunit alcohol dehydrogenase family)
MSLQGKDVLITGATGAIGSAIAEHLAARGAGVYLAGRDADKLRTLAAGITGAKTLPPANLDKIDEAQGLVTAFKAAAKNPYGLVCNAASLSAPGPFSALPFAEFQASFTGNLFSHLAMIHAFLPLVPQRGHIAVMSGAGLGATRSFANVSAYSTSKAALTHFVEALADEHPALSINAIAPGAVVSNMTRQALSAGRAVLGHYAEDAEKQVASGGVSPTLAARLIAWLFEQPEGQRLVSGRLLAARFDTDWLSAHASELDRDRFRMRRIDGTLFSRNEPK